jgi:hypothetical protein
MRPRLVMAVAAGLVLSGCYETGDAVFPLDGGDALPLKPGVYRCASGGPRDTVSFRVTPTEKNGRYLVNTHFGTIEDLEMVVSRRCVELIAQRDAIRADTLFHWWPRRCEGNPREETCQQATQTTAFGLKRLFLASQLRL